MSTILVAEDENHILFLIQRRLEAAGHTVVPFGDGRQALDYALEHRPDLLLLDIMLPGMDGLEICRRVKAAYKHEPPPIVLISARGQQTDVEVGLAAGADEYIIKPFSPRLLLETVEAML